MALSTYLTARSMMMFSNFRRLRLRRRFLPLSLLFLPLVAGCSGDEPAVPVPEVAEVRAAHEAWVTALNRQDVDYLEHHALPEISMFSASGRLRKDLGEAGWEAMRGGARQAGREQRRVEHQIEEIRVYGDVAMVTGHSRVGVTGVDGDRPELRRRLTYIWVRTDQGWRQAHHHVSDL